MVGVTELEASGPVELLAVMTAANDARATSATSVHDQSSRSHAVCRVSIRRRSGSDGMLTMVDLAGSERSKDSMYLPLPPTVQSGPPLYCTPSWLAQLVIGLLYYTTVQGGGHADFLVGAGITTRRRRRRRATSTPA